MITSLAAIIPLHGLGGRSDLPAPGWFVTYSAAVVVLLTFFALGALSGDSRFGRSEGSVGHALGRLLNGSGVRMAVRTLALAAFVAFLLVAWTGAGDHGQRNPAPTWFYVYFWVGLVPFSLLFGPLWAAINPLRTLASGLSALVRVRSFTLPDAVGHWPAAVGLAAFLWLELVYDDAASARVVAAFVSGYTILHLCAGVAFGPRWFTRCEAFEVYACMVARASPIGHAPDGRLVLRNPLRNLAATPSAPDLTPVVVLVLGSTGFDGLSRTTWWSDLTSGTSRVDYLVLGTVGLLGCVAAAVVTYAAAVVMMRPFLGAGAGGSLSPQFAPAIIPIAIGYTVAHYFSFAVFQGQQGAILSTDPLQRGWDLLGLAESTVNYAWPSTTAIAVIQVLAIVLGHVVAVLIAHDRAVTLLRPRDVLRGQSAMVAVMVLYTCLGIGLVAV